MKHLHDWILILRKSLPIETEVSGLTNKLFKDGRAVFVGESGVIVANSKVKAQLFFRLIDSHSIQNTRARRYTLELAIRTIAPNIISEIDSLLCKNRASVLSINYENDKIAISHFGVPVERIDEKDYYALIRFSIEL